jgi:predicted RNA-binding protein with RPS1 domain
VLKENKKTGQKEKERHLNEKQRRKKNRILIRKNIGFSETKTRLKEWVSLGPRHWRSGGLLKAP